MSKPRITAHASRLSVILIALAFALPVFAVRTTTTTVTGLPVSPTSFGTSVTFTATIVPNAGPAQSNGTVDFRDGGVTISGCGARSITSGSGQSTASCATSALSVAPHSITAIYSGSGGAASNDWNGSTSAGYSHTVTAAPTHLAITSVNGGSNPTAAIAFSIVVQAQDGSNAAANVISATAFSLTLGSGTGTLAGGTVSGSIPAGASQVTVTGVMYNKAESGVSITATRTSGDTLSAGTSAPFTVNAGAATTFQVTAPGTSTAGNAISVTVAAFDGGGNIAAGYTGTVHFTSIDAQAVLPADYTFTGGDAGTHVFSVTLKTAGNRTVTATDTVSASINGTTGTIVVAAASVNSLAITAPPTATAGLAFSVTVSAKDAFNNNATSYTGTVTFSTNDANAPVLPSDYTFTGADNGTHTFTTAVTLKTSGARTVTATDIAIPTLNATGNITVNAAAVNSLTITAPPTATAGVAFSVTVTAKDAFNNNATSYTGIVQFTTTDANAPVLPANYTFVIGDAGTHTFTNGVTLKTAATQTVTINDGTRNATSGAIVVSPAAVNSLVVTAPGTATAGVPISVTVTAKDAFNNNATSYTGTIAFSSNDANSPTLPSSYTFVGADNGAKTFTNGVTLKTAGGRTVSVNDGTRTGTSGTITVSPAAAATLVVSLPASATAGVAFTATVTAKDPFNNTATSYTGTVHFTTSATNAPVLPANYTFLGGDSGTHTFTGGVTLKNATVQSVTATDIVTASITGSANITINAANVAAIVFSLQPGSATAGAIFGAQPVLKTVDAFGNISIASLNNNVNVTISLFSGTGTLQGTTVINIGNNGPTPGTVSYANLRIDTAGSKVLRGSCSLGTADSNSFTVSPAIATQLYFATSPNGATAGSVFGTQPVIRSRDAFGNDSASGLAASTPITVAIASGTGTLQGTTLVDIGTAAGNGAFTFTDLRIDAAGTKTLGLSGLGTASSSSFTVSPSAPSAMIKIAGDGQTAAAGSTVATDPSVRIDDAFANPVPNISVSFAPSAVCGSVTGGTQLTNASGVATVTSWTLGPVSGAHTLTATAGALSQDFTATATCTYTSKASGNWNAPSTWIGECVPTSSDAVTISSGHTVTVTANAQAASITFPSASVDTNLNLNAGITFTVAGLLQIVAPSLPNVETTVNAGDATLNLGSLEMNGAGNREAILLIHNGTTNLSGNATFPGNPPTQTIDITGNGSFNIQGNFAAGATVEGSGNGTFRFNGTAQTIGGYNPNNYFPNVIIDSTLTMLGNWPVGGTLTINSGKTLNAGSGVLHLRGNLVDNGTLTTTGQVNVAGSAAQTFSGTANPIALANVTMNNAAGLTLATNVTVSGALTLTSGNISTGINTLTLLQSGSVARTSGHVIGNFAKVYASASSKTFEVGTANGYSPVTVNATSGSFPATFTAKATQGAHPNSPTANALQRYWTLNSGSITQADLTFNYLASDVVGNELAYRLGNYTGAWSYPAASVDTLNHIGSASGISTFGDYTLHAQAVALAITSINGGVNPNVDNAFSVTVKSVDALGNPENVSATTGIALTLNTGSGPLGGTLTGNIAAGTNTVVISGVTYHTAESGVVLTASATSGVTLTPANSAPFTVDPGATTHFSVTAPASSTAGSAFDLTVTARDQFNNVTPAFGGTVSFTSSDSQAVLPANATLVSGTQTFVGGVTLKTSGTQSITATSGAINGSANINVSPAAADHFDVSAPPITIAGTSFSATVTARDPYNNVATTYAGSVAITSSDSNATLPAASTLTSGVHAFNGIALTTAGAQTITAGDGSISKTHNITVNPGPLDHFLVQASAGGSIGTQTAGTSFTIRATAQDLYNNTVTSFASTAQITSNATLTGAPVTSGAFVAGVLASQSVTITSAQNNTTLTVTGAAKNGTSNTFIVNAGALDHFLVEAGGGGNVGTQTAATPFSIRATAKDTFNNTIPSFASTALITSNATLTGAPVASGAFVAGVLASQSVTITSAQNNTTLTVSASAKSGTSNAFLVNAGAVTHFRVEATTGGNIATQNAGSAFPIKITALDAGNNVATSFTGTVNITSTGTLSSGSGTTASFTNGVLLSHSVKIANVGSFTITATRTAGAESGTSNTFTVTGLADLNVSINSLSSVRAGEIETFTVRVKNEGVVVANNVALAMTKPSGWTLTYVSPCSFAPCTLGAIAGGATVDVHLKLMPPVGTAAGSYPVIATVTTSSSESTTSNNHVQRHVEVLQLTCDVPEISGVAETATHATYHVQWSDLGASKYILEESTNVDFTGATSSNTSSTSAAFTHDVTTPTAFFYRVHGVDGCSVANSRTLRVVVQPRGAATETEFDVVVEHGTTGAIQQPVHVNAPTGANALANGFVATSTASWLHVEPASGSIPPSGLDLTLTADPNAMPVGVSNATVNIRTTEGGTIASIPFALHAMAPITEGGKDATSDETLIIPAVGHAAGINSLWRSDVRIYNAANADATYELYFTPSRTNGTQSGKHATMTVPAGRTIALGDVVRRLFGYGSLGESATGALEIRPIEGAALPVITSRTFNATPAGTYGQFIPAMGTSSFVTSGSSLSLQQVAQSDAYRTNLGLLETSGEAANVRVRVYNDAGSQLMQLATELNPFEQRQLDSILTAENVKADDARIEVEVTSETGRVAAYASVVDNNTNDPLLVPGVVTSNISAQRYVIPGVAHYTTPRNTWRSDVRVFNAGNASVSANATFYPDNGTAPITRTINVAPREVLSADNVLESLFGATNVGGALHVATSNPSSLVVTARTYDHPPNGTYGQFIPAMTSADAAKLGGRAIDILHVDQSALFRSNIGFAEIAGSSARVEVTAVIADGRTATKTIDLAPYQFSQYGSLLTGMGLDDATNARVTIRVISGNGAVIAYASTIDNRTQDPTYVPAQ